MTKNPIEKWLSTNLHNLETLKTQNNGQHDKYTGIFPWQPPFIINVGNTLYYKYISRSGLEATTDAVYHCLFLHFYM